MLVWVSRAPQPRCSRAATFTTTPVRARSSGAARPPWRAAVCTITTSPTWWWSAVHPRWPSASWQAECDGGEQQRGDKVKEELWDGQWEANFIQPMRSWCQKANEKQMSFVQWKANVGWSMRSLWQMANDKQMSDGQWAAYVSRPMSSWCQLANENLISVGQWKAYISWPMISWCQLTDEQLMLIIKLLN